MADELGHFFGPFGSEVTIMGRLPNLLFAADEAVPEAFTDRTADRFLVQTAQMRPLAEQTKTASPSGPGPTSTEPPQPSLKVPSP